MEDLRFGEVVFEFQHADISIRRGASEKAARLMRRPGDDVYRCGVERVFVDSTPCGGIWGVGGGGCFAPNEDAAVVGGGSEDITVFRVGPGDRPDCSFVAGEI